MKNSLSRNITAFTLFEVFSETFFWGPIVILSIMRLGKMPLADIYFMESACVMIALVLNIPAGMIADLYGRKFVLLIGSIATLISAIMFAGMHDPLTAWISNIFWAISLGFISGADSAILYNVLAANRMQRKFKIIMGRASSYRLALQSIGSLIAGVLATHSLRLPLYASIPTLFIPIGSILLMKDVDKSEDKNKKRLTLKELANISIDVLKKKEVRFMIVFATVLGAVGKVWFFTYNPYFELVNVPLTQYGIIFASCSGVACLASYNVERIERLLGEKNTLILMVVCVSFPILLMGLFPIYIFAFLPLIQNIVRGTMKPLVEQYLNKYIGSAERTTVLSAYSTISCLAGVFALAVFGAVIKYASLSQALILLGASALIFGAISYRKYISLYA